ncbi:hypothetical protein [Pseudothermotoga sp.]
MEENKFASGKFLLALLITGMLVTLNLFGKVSSNDSVNQLVVLCEAYAGANVVSKFTQR